MLQLWSLEIEDFVEEVLVSLDPIQHTTPTSTKLGASETVPFRVVLLGEFFAIPARGHYLGTCTLAILSVETCFVYTTS